MKKPPIAPAPEPTPAPVRKSFGLVRDQKTGLYSVLIITTQGEKVLDITQTSGDLKAIALNRLNLFAQGVN